MKKSLSYVLPIAALVILALLAFRWLSNRPDSGTISPSAESAEGIEISDVTGEEAAPTGIIDMESTRLTTPESLETPAQGEVRYGKTVDNKTRFTISADLPKVNDNTEFYQLWIEGDKGRKKAMRLSYEKGGYMAEGELSAEFEQVKVVVSKEITDDDQVEEVQLEGMINLK